MGKLLGPLSSVPCSPIKATQRMRTSCQEQPIAPEEERSSRLAGMLDTSGPLDVYLFNLLFTWDFARTGPTWESVSCQYIFINWVESTTLNSLFSEWHVGNVQVFIVSSCKEIWRINSLTFISFDKILSTHWILPNLHQISCWVLGFRSAERSGGGIRSYASSGEFICFLQKLGTWSTLACVVSLKTAGIKTNHLALFQMSGCECEAQIRTWQRIRASKKPIRFQSRSCLTQMFGKGW